MKSYQHSDKSEELKGVAGFELVCVCVSHVFSFAYIPPAFALPLDGWMDGRVCMYADVRSILF